MSSLQATDSTHSDHTLTLDKGMEVLRATGSHLTSLMAEAHRLKEKAFGDRMETCSVINAKSGRCGEDCAFCAQSARYSTQAPVYPLKSSKEILESARRADSEGVHCFGIVTSGTRLRPGEETERILDTIREIRRNTSVTPSASLGILDAAMAQSLAAAGCVTYHHNLETARSFFPSICTTHDYEEDIETIRVAKRAGMKVCSGGIFGLGESLEQRVELALTLRDLEVDSVPINFLNPIAGTPLEGRTELSPLDCIRIVVLFRLAMPERNITVCGGRDRNLRDFQSWLFIAGASGMMVGDYLTTSGRDPQADQQMLIDAEVTFR